MPDPNVLDRLRAANPYQELPAPDLRADALLHRIVSSRRSEKRYRPKLWRPAVAGLMAVALLLTVLHISAPAELPVIRTGDAHTALIAAAERAGDNEARTEYRVVAESSVVLHHANAGREYDVRLTYPVTTQVDDGGNHRSLSFGTMKLTPLTAADAQAFQADGSPEVDSGPDAPASPGNEQILPGFDENLIFEGDLEQMPTDPVALREAMLDWVADHGEWWTHLPGLAQRPQDPAAWLFREGTKILSNDYDLEPARRAGIYQMMAGLPGVRTVSGTDPAGREAIGLVITEKTGRYGTMEWQLYLNPKRDEVLAIQSVVKEPGSENFYLTAGTVYSSYVVKELS
ncbi:hypothetical protein [Kineosporia babensis]|uniref:Uncharacterized protein n=1 Tax=Kineosporia babensis TaxID=499548 RepID=A0A9X1NB50_9ACTN|nr:hypothetical protein [Kineosporia babensis]MCD5311972.1 hypothetical protein [Kineosporia babensis]